MKYLLITIFSLFILIGILLVYSPKSAPDHQGNSNVSVMDGTQIIEIMAKGGYSPQYTLAKANIPTIVKVKTQGTFDCSSALVIPSINYNKNLPFSGETLITIAPPKASSTLQGICAMGMYNFTISFQ